LSGNWQLRYITGANNFDSLYPAKSGHQF
jgi:hypothetical protein